MSNEWQPMARVEPFRADGVLDALGDATRRQILRRLRDGPLPVGELAASLPVGRPAVSKHLRVLEGAGLVEHNSIGTRNLYTLAPHGLVALQQWLVDTWDVALSAFAARVTEYAHRGRETRHGVAADPAPDRRAG
jgi:DNA-binding transcriptional ArsR family regulator